MSLSQQKIAIIGGGIAGAAACLQLLKYGYQPLWFAPKIDDRDKPGEHLAPAARPLLIELNALDLLDKAEHRDANIQFSAWGSDQLSERSGMLHLEGAAMVINRCLFENGLRQKVIAQGINPIQTRVTSSQFIDNLWQIKTDQETLFSDWIIDATGRGSSIAKQFSTRCRADELITAISFLHQKTNSNVEPTHATLIETSTDGWWYASLLADGRLAVNFYTDPKLLAPNIRSDVTIWQHRIAQTQHISRWIEDAEFIIDEPPQLYGASTTWLAPSAEEHWLAIGDAAAAFDPLSSHGMTTALWTAISAVDTLHNVINGVEPDFQSYNKKVALGVQEFLAARQSVYAMEQRYNDQPFWSTRMSG